MSPIKPNPAFCEADQRKWENIQVGDLYISLTLHEFTINGILFEGGAGIIYIVTHKRKFVYKGCTVYIISIMSSDGVAKYVEYYSGNFFNIFAHYFTPHVS